MGHLPHDLPPKSTVYVYFAQWRKDGTWQKLVDALRAKVRTEVEGREATPSAGSIDSQSVKTAGQPAGARGTTEPRRSPAASVIWWWIRWVCCWRSW